MTRLNFLTITALLVVGGCDKKRDDGKAAKPEPSAPAPAPGPAAPSAPTAPTPTGGTMTGKPVDACSLITKADAEAATGQKLGDGEAKGSTCSFYDKDKVMVVYLKVDPWKDAAMAKLTFEGVRSHERKAEPASGFGDAAYWDELMEAPRLNILKGSSIVMVQVGWITDKGVPKEAARKAAATLARQVLGKLP